MQLKRLACCQMVAELGLVKMHRGGLQSLGIGKLPLARGSGDLQADETVDRISGQDDLCASAVSQNRVQNPPIMVLKEAKA